MRLQVHRKTLDVGPIQTLLRQGENLADAIIIAMDRYYNGLDRAALTWRVRAYTEKETMADLWVPSIIAMNETVELLWEVTKEYTQVEGLIRVELIGVKDDVKTVINAEALRVWPDVANAYTPSDSSWQTALDRVQQGVASASASASAAKASETNAKASETNAKASETNAKASETKAQISAADCARAVEQAQEAAKSAKASRDESKAFSVVAQEAVDAAIAEAEQVLEASDQVKEAAEAVRDALSRLYHNLWNGETMGIQAMFDYIFGLIARYHLQGISWDKWDALSLSWDAFEALDMTWDEFEIWKGEPTLVR